ncbi:MAG: glycerol kinase GlpK [Bacteroidales bacterium]|nr:glycerol kinase GlpK [Bacteroidales bacterium]
MTEKYILALDQGTSSSRAILFNRNLQLIGIEQEAIRQSYPKKGWVEQNPEDIWQSLYNSAKKLLRKRSLSPGQISSIGITNQRETTIVWNKKTGKPIYPAIVWQDTRTSDYCNTLKEEGYETLIRKKTGLLIDSYFSATKVKWILKNVKGAEDKAKKGELLFGTVDSWILWKLTQGQLHYTDYSNASRTLLFDIEKLQWSEDLLNIFDIPESMLPKAQPTSKIYGHTHPSIFGKEIAIASMVGDQQSALFGQRCLEPGQVKNTYGTGCFMLMNTGNKIIHSNSGLLTTIAWGIDGEINYAIEGSVFIAGAAIQWLRDEMQLIKTAAESEQFAMEVTSSNGLYFVPAFTGLGAPYWDMYARGAIMGLSRDTNYKHIVRATLESLAYQTKDVLDAMTQDSGIKLRTLNVDGGATANNFLMQFQSDILDKEVIRPAITETTALGAALLAGIATGFWTKEEIMQNRQIDRKFKPEMKANERIELYTGWLDAVNRVRSH